MPDFDSTLGQLLFSTTLLRCKLQDNGTEYGTAFVFDLETKDGDLTFLVTCRHVIAKSTEATFHLTAQKPDDGSDTRNLDLGNPIDVRIGGADKWFSHPDPQVDLAVMPLIPILAELDRKLGVDAYVNSIPSGSCPTAAHGRLIGLNDRVVYVGYPYGLQDDRNLLPLIRSGRIASYPDVNYDGKPGFYVDAHLHPGSSGSPVLIQDQLLATREDGAAVLHDKNFFIGVATTSSVAPSGPFAGQEIGLGFVTHADLVLDTIDKFLKR